MNIEKERMNLEREIYQYVTGIDRERQRIIDSSQHECERVKDFLMTSIYYQLSSKKSHLQHNFDKPFDNIKKYSFKHVCPKHYDYLSTFFKRVGFNFIYKDELNGKQKNDWYSTYFRTINYYDVGKYVQYAKPFDIDVKIENIDEHINPTVDIRMNI